MRLIRQKSAEVRSLHSWRNCICARSFGGEAAILAALPREASAQGARSYYSYQAVITVIKGFFVFFVAVLLSMNYRKPG